MKKMFHLTAFVLLCVMTFTQVYGQQKITVSGKVTDGSSKEPKAGVTVQTGKPLRGIGTTDEDGIFSVSVAVGEELVFTHSGYNDVKKRITAADAGRAMNITISLKDASLDEVVVQGFRSTKKAIATGSSTVISGRQVQDVPASNVISLLQGKVAGLNIQNNTGSPGAMGTINLRGLSSIKISGDGMLTPTSPLFIIDGVPIDVNSGFEYGFQSGGVGVNPLALIPPEDVEQFDVLRDAAATSQYGSRGAYGVILITTRRGKSKVPRVQYVTNMFLNVPPPLREVIGGKDERMTRIRTILENDTSLANAYARINSSLALSDSLNPYYNNSTNWQAYSFRSTINHQHNISVLGGDDKFNYKTNLNYYDEQGIMVNTGFKRYSLNMNALYSPTNAFRMQVTLNGSLGMRNNGDGIGLIQPGNAKNANNSSIMPPPSLFSENNSALASVSVQNNNKTVNISSSFDVQYELVKGLRLSNLLTFNFNTGTTNSFTPSYLNNDISKSLNQSDRSSTLFNRSILNYAKNIGDHEFNAYVFNEVQSVDAKTNIISLRQTAGDQIQGPIGYNSLLSAGGILDNLRQTRIHGYGGSVAYNYDRKYIVELNYRLDGTSINGPNRPYSENPAVSAKWNFGFEDFMSEIPWLSSGGLRASWGKNITPTGSIYDVHGRYQVGLPYNNNPTVTINQNVVPNENYLPETKTESNLALEFGLFNNRLDATIETYYRSIDNQVLGINLANITGFTKYNTNDVSLVNYGLELTTRFRITKDMNKPFQWTVNFTGELRRDVLTRLPDGLRQIETTIKEYRDGRLLPGTSAIHKIGKNAISNLLYHTSGVYNSTSDVPVNLATGIRQQLGAGTGFYFQGGDPKWTDINGDYIIDYNDMQPIGNPIPRMTGGVYSQMSYKNFRLDVQVAYTLLRDIMNIPLSDMLTAYTNPFSFSAMLPIDNYKYWKPSATDKSVGQGGAIYANPFDYRRAGTLNPFRVDQTLFLEDGSYWKINTVTLAYNFGKNLLQKLHMTSARVTLSAYNVYTFSNYSGPDPELVTALGRDYSGGYPKARSYSIGLNVQF